MVTSYFTLRALNFPVQFKVFLQAVNTICNRLGPGVPTASVASPELWLLKEKYLIIYFIENLFSLAST